MTSITLTIRLPGLPPLPRWPRILSVPLRRLVVAWRTWRRNEQARRELANLDDAALRDLGLSRSDLLALGIGRRTLRPPLDA